MAKEKLDFTQNPISLELGSFLSVLSESKEYKDMFTDKIYKISSSIMDKNKITLPLIYIVRNLKLKPREMRVLIYGKEIYKGEIIDKNYIMERVLWMFEKNLKNNLFYFEDDFKEYSLKFDEMLHEQSREAYQFMFRYYSSIEIDKKEAFHWLKKLCYYNVPQDIRELANFYREGRGCDKDTVMSEKLMNKQSRRRFKAKRF